MAEHVEEPEGEDEPQAVPEAPVREECLWVVEVGKALVQVIEDDGSTGAQGSVQEIPQQAGVVGLAQCAVAEKIRIAADPGGGAPDPNGP